MTTISHTTERKFFFLFFLRSNRARQNRYDRKIDSYSKEGRTIKAWSREFAQRWTDYAIAGEDARRDSRKDAFPASCFTVGQSPPHISDASRPSIKLREWTTYVPDLVCPPTSVITFASVTTLRRCLRGGTCFRNSLMAAASAAVPFIDSPPMYLMICREYGLISRSLPPLELYGYFSYYPCRFRDAFGMLILFSFLIYFTDQRLHALQKCDNI